MRETLRALIVEDVESDALLIVRELQRGFEVSFERVETPDQMAAALARGCWDIVIADFVLPRFSAPAALALLQGRGADVPFIIVSGQVGEEAAVEAMRSGAEDFVSKSNFSRLIPAVERELREAAGRAERARIEEQLRISRENEEIEHARLAAIVESSSDAIISKTLDGTIVSWNHAAELLFGYRADEIVGKSVWELIPERSRDEEEQLLERLGRGEWIEPFDTMRRRKDGGEFEVSVRLSPIKDASGNTTGVSTVARDITEIRALVQAKEAAEAAFKENAIFVQAQLEREIAARKRAAAQLRHAAYHDALTGLPNRLLFLDRLRGAIRCMRRHPDAVVAVLFIDVDRFKFINDSFGHVVGDRFLTVLAGRIGSCLRPDDVLARMGGDEFTILLEKIAGERDAAMVADRILRAVIEPVTVDGHSLAASVSIGIALGALGHADADSMLRNADIAMYRAKQMGGCRSELFVPDLHSEMKARLQLELDFRRALERDELRLAYQPILDVETGKVTAFEALARWKHPERGMIPPATFVHLAEDSGLIVPLGEWVLFEACRQARTWQDARSNGPVRVNVNVSPKQLGSQADYEDRLSRQLDRVLCETGLDPASVNLEITECALLESADEAEVELGRLRALGAGLQLDGFGTGYSSLSYLQRLPIDTIKIDRSFISGPGGAGMANPRMVGAIVGMALNLGKCVTAEGIETSEQLDQARALHCTNAQGYYLSHPLDAAGARALANA